MNTCVRARLMAAVGFVAAGLTLASPAAWAAAPVPAQIGSFPGDVAVPADRPGLCLDLGCGDGKLAAEVAQKTKYFVFALAKDDADCDKARQALDAAGLYGARATAMAGSLKALPFPNGYGNLIVTGDYQESLDLKEVSRVLNPNGVAVIGGGKADAAKLKSALEAAGIKDYKISGNCAVFPGKMPAGTDDWTHNHYDPASIRTSKETLVRPPFRTQWVWIKQASPPGLFVCNLVVANGRMIHRTDKGHYYVWDAFNGTLLWERQGKMSYPMSPQALIDGVCYALESDKIVALDALTGRETRSYPTPDGGQWLWLAVDGGTLYGLTRGSLKYEGPIGEWFYALDLKDGKVLWKYQSPLPVDMRSACLGEGFLYFYAVGAQGKALPPDPFDKWARQIKGDCEVRALDLKTGQEKWKTVLPWESLSFRTSHNPSAGYYDGKYFIWGGAKASRALDAKTGAVVKEYPGVWSRATGGNEQCAPLIVDGKMYISGRKTVDIATGEQIDPVRPRVGCGAGSASANCLFNGGQGLGAFDLLTKKGWALRGMMRSACIEGSTPANGLLFNMPGACGCPYLITTPVALAPTGPEWRIPEANKDLEARLLAGPAAAAALVEDGKDAGAQNAPKTPAGTHPTSPVFGGGMSYAASREGIVWAADGATGEIRWRFLCGGGVTVTPAYWRGRLLLGSDDGWVYCLEAKTGKLAWRFRAAPEERHFNMRGEFISNWPVRTGVAVDGELAYCGAGLYPYDGAYLYALDAKTGKPAWARRIGDVEHLDGAPLAAISVVDDKIVIGAVEGMGRKPEPTASAGRTGNESCPQGRSRRTQEAVRHDDGHDKKAWSLGWIVGRSGSERTQWVSVSRQRRWQLPCSSSHRQQGAEPLPARAQDPSSGRRRT